MPGIGARDEARQGARRHHVRSERALAARLQYLIPQPAQQPALRCLRRANTIRVLSWRAPISARGPRASVQVLDTPMNIGEGLMQRALRGIAGTEPRNWHASCLKGSEPATLQLKRQHLAPYLSGELS